MCSPGAGASAAWSCKWVTSASGQRDPDPKPGNSLGPRAVGWTAPRLRVLSRLPASRPPAARRQLPGWEPGGGWPPRLPRAERPCLAPASRRRGIRGPGARGAMFRLARVPGGAQSCSGQRVWADERVFWTPCSVDGWGKQRPPVALISGSERDRWWCSPGVGAERTLAWPPGYGGAEIQCLWPWESQVTGEWGSAVHGVMRKVHLQLTSSSPHLPTSKDWVKSWGDKGRDWER